MLVLTALQRFCMSDTQNSGPSAAAPHDNAAYVSKNDLFAKLTKNAQSQLGGGEDPEQDPEPVVEDTPESEEPEEEIAEEAADDSPEVPDEDSDEERPPGMDDEEEPEEPEDDNPPKDREVVSKKTFEKRLGKATAKIKNLERERDALQQKLVAKPAETPDPNNPLSFVTTSAELVQQERNANSLLDQVTSLKLKAKRSPEEVTQLLEKEGIQTDDPELWLEEKAHHLNSVINRQIPERRQFVQQREALLQTAQTKYPWLKDSSNEKTQWVEGVKAQYPQLAAVVPDVDLFLARAHRGWVQEARERITPTKKQPPRQPGKPKTSGVSRKRNSDPMAQAKKQAQETGDNLPIFSVLAARAKQKKRPGK